MDFWWRHANGAAGSKASCVDVSMTFAVMTLSGSTKNERRPEHGKCNDSGRRVGLLGTLWSLSRFRSLRGKARKSSKLISMQQEGEMELAQQMTNMSRIGSIGKAQKHADR
jgi:hypothetical protein